MAMFLKKIIIDNRTEEDVFKILPCLSQIKNKVQIVKVGNKQVNCSIIENDKSNRFLFSYQKDIQGQLF